MSCIPSANTPPNTATPKLDGVIVFLKPVTLGDVASRGFRCPIRATRSSGKPADLCLNPLSFCESCELRSPRRNLCGLPIITNERGCADPQFRDDNGFFLCVG